MATLTFCSVCVGSAFSEFQRVEGVDLALYRRMARGEVLTPAEELVPLPFTHGSYRRWVEGMERAIARCPHGPEELARQQFPAMAGGRRGR